MLSRPLCHIRSAFCATAPTVSRRFMASLTLSTLNLRVLDAQYAVRGELILRADAIKAQIQQLQSQGKPSPFPFTEIVHCNIGNPQELGQKPLTFHRQVLALCQCPDLIQSAPFAFAPDAIARAQQYLTQFTSAGAYTNSMGIPMVREEVAKFIATRDGHEANVENIFLTDGASTGVKNILQLLIRDNNDTVLTPIPQYPLYSATLSLLGTSGEGYYLNESTNWSLSIAELNVALQKAQAKHHVPRALVVINPGNPTGQCLTVDTMKQIIEFCVSNNLVLMADEVYQENIYSTIPFNSFKNIACEMASPVELISFHSTSKGFIGECGQRGGYMELFNIDREVVAQIYKLASISLCSNVSGQLMTGLMVNPPKRGDASYEQYEHERSTILESLKRRAKIVERVLNTCEGVSCQPVQGAMYAFPSVKLSDKLIAHCRSINKLPDTFYCLSLLESTGLVTVPGSGFGQRPNEFHFRLTILPKEEKLASVLDRFKAFHQQFMAKWRD